MRVNKATGWKMVKDPFPFAGYTNNGHSFSVTGTTEQTIISSSVTINGGSKKYGLWGWFCLALYGQALTGGTATFQVRLNDATSGTIVWGPYTTTSTSNTRLANPTFIDLTAYQGQQVSLYFNGFNNTAGDGAQLNWEGGDSWIFGNARYIYMGLGQGNAYGPGAYSQIPPNRLHRLIVSGYNNGFGNTSYALWTDRKYYKFNTTNNGGDFNNSVSNFPYLDFDPVSGEEVKNIPWGYGSGNDWSVFVYSVYGMLLENEQ